MKISKKKKRRKRGLIEAIDDVNMRPQMLKTLMRYCKDQFIKYQNSYNYGHTWLVDEPFLTPAKWKCPYNIFPKGIGYRYHPDYYRDFNKKVSCTTSKGGTYLIERNKIKHISVCNPATKLLFLTQSLCESAVNQPIELNQWRSSWRDLVLNSRLERWDIFPDGDGYDVGPNYNCNSFSSKISDYKDRVERNLCFFKREDNRKTYYKLYVQLTVSANMSFSVNRYLSVGMKQKELYGRRATCTISYGTSGKWRIVRSGYTKGTWEHVS